MNKHSFLISQIAIAERRRKLLSTLAQRIPASLTDPLALDNIQGNIVPGFGMQFQKLLFFTITKTKEFEKWLQSEVPRITTAEKVIEMRPLLKMARDRKLSTKANPALKESWTNIAFTAKGLRRLGLPADEFEDQAFKQGMARRSVLLGDPKKKGKDGHQSKWKVGGTRTAADFMLIVGNNDQTRLSADVKKIEQLLNKSAKQIHSVMGTRLKNDKEHFGFRDAISQPGLRGLDDNDPRKRRNLVEPGEFVFGYPGEDRAPGIPNWARDGSFLVFRRLRQDVQEFNAFLKRNGQKVPPSWLAAQLVGRWKSGAPLTLASKGDNKELGEDEIASNVFSFANDASGQICPFGSHIRKVYPRDDDGRLSIQTHRLLRRGIPYQSSNPTEKGLLFLAYQTSIVNQFEHVMRKWAGNPNFRQPNTGADLLLAGPTRMFPLNFRGRLVRLSGPRKPLVVPTGGGYFFVPSIEALRQISSIGIG